MRIIAGKLGGRIFESPHGHTTHPMADRVRGGLFNALGDISGLTVLDAFAGSGALGFEALSRGATSVLAVEQDKSAQRSMEMSAKALGLRQTFKLIRASIGGWLNTTSGEQQFDIILVDPPYDDLQINTIERLVARLKPGGIFVLSWPGKQPALQLESLEIIRAKSYGDAQLVFYRG